MLKRITTLLLSTAVLFACESDDEGELRISMPSVMNFAIDDAVSLRLADAGQSSRSNGSDQKLFKYDETGAFVEVTFTDEETGEVYSDRVSPTRITNMSPEIVAIAFNTEYYDSTYVTDVYFINKSTGKAFQLNHGMTFDLFGETNPENHTPAFGWTPLSGATSDQDGSIYARLSISTETEYLDAIAQFDVTATGISVSLASLDGENATQATVSIDGTLTYGLDTYQTRIVKKDGGLLVTPSGLSPSHYMADHLIELNHYSSAGEIYGDYYYHVEAISYDYLGNELERTVAINGDVEQYVYCSGFDRFESLVAYDCGTYLDLEDFTLHEGLLPLGDVEIVDTQISNLEFVYLHTSVSSTQKMVSAVSLETGTIRTLVDVNLGYDVSTIALNASGLLEFTAYRLSDGAKVLGRLDTTDVSAVIEIIDTSLSTIEIDLIPVN
jgi:hypothetical protein